MNHRYFVCAVFFVSTPLYALQSWCGGGRLTHLQSWNCSNYTWLIHVIWCDVGHINTHARFCHQQGSHAPGKSWIFLSTISRTWKVLEIWVQGPWKSWNFLGYDNDVGGGQNDAGADAEICVFAHLYQLFR